MDLEKATKILKQKLDVAERENQALKKSLFELSNRYNSVAVQKSMLPFQLDMDVLDVIQPLLDSPVEMEPMDQVSVAANSTNGSNGRKDKWFAHRFDLKGHTGAVYAVEFSPCGRLLASGSFDKSVRIWDVGAQNSIHVLKKHELNVSDVSWSNDSLVVVSGGYDQTCRTWDVEQGKPLDVYGMDGFVQCVAFNPQGYKSLCRCQCILQRNVA